MDSNHRSENAADLQSAPIATREYAHIIGDGHLPSPIFYQFKPYPLTASLNAAPGLNAGVTVSEILIFSPV